MSAPIELSVGQQFEIERFNRAIDATADPDQLRNLAKQLLQAWHSQKAATQWVMRQQLGSPPRFGSDPAGALLAEQGQPPQVTTEPGSRDQIQPFRDIL